MQFIKKIKFTFLGLVLSILLPLITIIVVFMALYNYTIVYNSILDGFNKKLLAIASTTSSFINGDEHQAIAMTKQMNAFTYDENTSSLYAISSESQVNRIHLNKGAAITVEGFDKNKLKKYIIYDMAMDSKKNLLYVVTYTKEILSLNLRTKEIKVVKRLNFIADGIAYENKTFYLSSNSNLYKLEENYKAVFLKKYPKFMNTLNILNGKLYTINKEDHTILSIDLDTLEYTDDIAKNFPLENENISHLAISKDYFYSGKNNLILYERNSSKVIEDNFARFYRDETSALYLKYIQPMSEIKMSLNLSYHYTFNLLYGDSENNCFYILDVNEGTEYTPIGSYDSMDAKELTGAENVLLRDATYLSDIKLWDKWGLLKVAYSGIEDKHGKMLSVAGADIEISIIRKKTKEALIQAILIGILALIVGIFISYYIAIKIIRPIEILKTSALKIAAGNYSDNVVIKSPKELSELSLIFNDMSQELKLTIDDDSLYGLDMQDNKVLRRLKTLCTFNSEFISVDNLIDSPHLVGIVETEDHIYIYSIEEVFDSSLEVNKRRIIINDILKRYINTKGLSEFIRFFNPSGFIIIEKKDVHKIILIKKDSQSNRITKSNYTNKSKVFKIKDIQFSIV